jgi:hypothetical protein
MSEPTPTHADDVSAEEIPWGQRLFDRPFLLLLIGILVMAICFTGWGLWEVMTLPSAPLP